MEPSVLLVFIDQGLCKLSTSWAGGFSFEVNFNPTTLSATDRLKLVVQQCSATAILTEELIVSSEENTCQKMGFLQTRLGMYAKEIRCSPATQKETVCWKS